MKEDEKDYEYLDTPPEVMKRGMRFITRPKSLDRILNTPSGRRMKGRISIYLDVEIINHFKAIAEKEGTGYQTLINNTLRKIVDGEQKDLEKEDLKNDLLKDKRFLRKLKTALSV